MMIMAKVAFLLASGFEDSEMKNPYEAIKEAGHETVILGNEKGETCEGKKKTISYVTGEAAEHADPNEFDAVVIPGGSAPEALRIHEGPVEFVKKMNDQSKLVAAICHGAQVMISADILEGKELRSETCEGKKKTISYVTGEAAEHADPNEFDAVVIPGGSAPEALRIHEGPVEFVKKMNDQSKLVAAICHGAQVMISADILEGKEL